MAGGMTRARVNPVTSGEAHGLHLADRVARGWRLPGGLLLSWVTRALVHVHFGRAVLAGPGRLPRHGGALLVANHPASWTDVVVLDALLRRPLRFLALEPLFHRWPAAALLALQGALPVCAADDPEHVERNARTLLRSREALARGEVVAVFPAGVSRPGVSAGHLRPGAARLALAAAAAGLQVPLVPATLLYEEGRANRPPGVTVVLGEPVPHADLVGETDAEARLTARLAAAIARGAHEPRPREGVRRAPSSTLRAAAVLGRALHAPATLLVLGVASRWRDDPTRVTFARLATGLVVYPVWSAALAFAWTRLVDWPLIAVVPCTLGVLSLGACAARMRGR